MCDVLCVCDCVVIVRTRFACSVAVHAADEAGVCLRARALIMPVMCVP
jgi:hypothetical protein